MNRKLLLAPFAVAMGAILASNAWTSEIEDFQPICDAGAVQFVEMNGLLSSCPLDGTASYDPDGGALTYFWEDLNPLTYFDDPNISTPTLFADMGTNCMVECGAVRLTVTDDEGNTATCTTAVVFEDTLAPVLTVPDDEIMLYAGGFPAQTDPNLIGWAVTTDLHDPNPSLIYGDVVVNGVPPTGIEQVITRTWYTQDMCDWDVTDVQVITLVGESFYDRVQLDIMPNLCPNTIRADQTYVFRAVVPGSEKFDTRQVDPRSLLLKRKDGLGDDCLPFRSVLADIGRGIPGNPCISRERDGYPDIVMLFFVPAVSVDLDLPSIADGTEVTIFLKGEDGAGFPFQAEGILKVLHDA